MLVYCNYKVCYKLFAQWRLWVHDISATWPNTSPGESTKVCMHASSSTALVNACRSFVQGRSFLLPHIRCVFCRNKDKALDVMQSHAVVHFEDAHSDRTARWVISVLCAESHKHKKCYRFVSIWASSAASKGQYFWNLGFLVVHQHAKGGKMSKKDTKKNAIPAPWRWSL